MEDQMNGLINGMLKDNSPGAMAFNIFLMVVVAAFAEELFFRGALQRFLVKQSGDEHLSIFISAVIFSSVHMQFYGFMPRLTLGILFGYMYYRTGRLIAPILAHALFNGLQVGTYYYATSKAVDAGEEELMLLPASYTIVSTLLFLLMYYSFHASTEKKD
jgi:membrane protease YdiL (CAAX protease family)